MTRDSEPEQPFELTLSAEEAGQRLDRVLGARALGVSRAALQRWIAAGLVTVDGRPATSKTKAIAGAHVVVHPAPPAPSTAEPEDIPLAIVHEDEDLLVIDKPAGLVVHPAPGHPRGTLANAVAHRLAPGAPGASGRVPDPARPGIVHRLDKDTSGVLVVAKTELAYAALQARFAKHDVERVYLAIALGAPPESATYATLYSRHARDRKRFTSRTDRGRRAVTHVRVKERLHGAALVECRLETGRTHQIRVHLADHRHPVLADVVYGRASKDPTLRAAADAIGRQALHAAVLGFPHPRTNTSLRFESPLPADFARALDLLRPAP